MSIRLGLFDILQVDPTDRDDDAAVYRRRLDDLALADELGFAFAFTAERHFMPTYRCPAPSVWLAAAGQRTRRMRLGVMAYTLPLHDPVRLAEEVAVLDHLCGGRLEVGLGLGHRSEELIAVGVDPAQRIPLFRERLAVMQALWSGGRVALESEHHTLREVAIHPLPLQEPHPPLWYAGTDPDAAVWVGALGLGLALGFRPTERLRPSATAFATARRGRMAAFERGDAPDAGGPLALMRHVYVAETDERAHAEMTDDLLRLRELGPPVAPGGAHGGAGGRRHGQGSPADGSRADRRAAAADAEGLVRDEIVLAGGPETVATAIATACRALGAEVFLANVYAAGVEDDRVRRALRLLAAEVAPRLEEVREGMTVD